MKLIKTNIPEILIIQPNLYNDERGYFRETFNKKNSEELLGDIFFVQENQSKSKKGVLRGLHFQSPPYEQSKLIECLQGEIIDVAVDIRTNSKSFGMHHSIVLSGTDNNQLYIPKGFAHGFLVLSDSALVSYKVDNYYNPDFESGIYSLDSELKIDWRFEHKNIIMSKKDKNLKPFSKFSNPF